MKVQVFQLLDVRMILGDISFSYFVIKFGTVKRLLIQILCLASPCLQSLTSPLSFCVYTCMTNNHFLVNGNWLPKIEAVLPRPLFPSRLHSSVLSLFSFDFTRRGTKVMVLPTHLYPSIKLENRMYQTESKRYHLDFQ